jgi:hypothetical protein
MRVIGLLAAFISASHRAHIHADLYYEIQEH